ncbi:MAG TPA: heat-inducible transcriptional repressor HrcA [Atopostipes sp.]|nr:heat-inducible transcriptional repressor HrcA [Atopostipes sp.]
MLTERQLLILNKIIERFTKDGQPVGSKTLVEDGAVDASSATIRNEMSVLEELGYIEKVHSSSGRVPSVKGYRFYVDHLMRPKRVNTKERSKIKSSMNSQIYEMSDVFYQSAELLSELTNYTAIVLGPQSKQQTLTGFRILPLNQRQMMLVMQLDNFEVQNMIFKIPEGLRTEYIRQVTDFMNRNLVGESLHTVYYALKNDLPSLFEKYLAMNWDVTEMLERTLLHFKDDQLFVSGKTNILDFTEDMDIRQVKDLYNLLDNEGTLFTLFNSLYDRQRTYDIRIGKEFDDQLFESFSLMTVPYQDDQFGGGFIAVLGPTNMTYDSTLGVIQVLREELLDRLEDFYLK